MQKGDIAKLKLLLAGISARMTKNRDYFIRAVCTFTSGKKKFDAELSLDGQDWALRFQGSTSPTDAAAFCAFFASEAEKFDESVLVYTERSAVVTLSATARGVQMKQAEREASDEEKANAANPLLDSGRQYLIRVDQAAALLREIGILTADGKLKNDMIRKYNQIDHYVELVAPMFEQDDSDEIVLLDCACGKSYLSFVMNYYLHEVLHRRCRVIGVDICHFAPRLRYCDRSCPCDRAPCQSEIHRVRALLSQGTARSVYHARPRTADPSRRLQGALQ